MSMFLCADCDQMRDADDGCEEASGFRLICQDCADEREAEREQAEHDEAEDRRRDNPLEPDFRRLGQ